MASQGGKGKGRVPEDTEVPKKSRGLNVTMKQRAIYVDFCTLDRAPMEPTSPHHENKWVELCQLLDNAGPPRKKIDEWKDNFRGWIYQLRHKKRVRDEHEETSGAGTAQNKFQLSNIEKKALGLYGIIVVDGDDSLQSRGFGDAHCSPPPPVASTSEESSSADSVYSPPAGPSRSSTPTSMNSVEDLSRSRKRSSLDILSDNMKEYIELKKRREDEKSEREERQLVALERFSEGFYLMGKSLEKERKN